MQEPLRVLRRGSAATHRTSAASFEIAGVRFVLRDGLFPGSFSPAYRTFVPARYRGAGRITVSIRLRADGRAVAPPAPFHRTEGWMLARDGNYLLALAPPVLRGRALLTARFPPGVGHVELTVADPRCNPIAYPVDQILMMHLLAPRGGAILHACGLGLGRRGYAFCGCSGAGKSTLARQLDGRGRWTPLSDDRVIVRRIGERYRVFGTPWPGTGEVAENRSFPCAGLIFLRHAAAHRLERVPAREALHRLLPVASVPWYDRTPMEEVLDFLGGLAERVPAWELSFRPDRSLAPFLEEALGGTRP